MSPEYDGDLSERIDHLHDMAEERAARASFATDPQVRLRLFGEARGFVRQAAKLRERAEGA